MAAVPAHVVPEVLREAADSGVKATIIVSGGFAEAGNRDLDAALKEIIRSSNIRVMGPNTLGVLDLHTGVNTFFIPEFKNYSGTQAVSSVVYPRPGSISMISQSGALAGYFVEALAERNGGLRAVACVGNQVDVRVEELVSFFAEDELTKVLAIYVEGIVDGRLLLNQVLKARKNGKTVVVLKAGRSKTTEKAAYIHTASMVGEWDVFVGALRQAGAIVVESIRELVDAAYAASLTKLPMGREILVVANAGGLSVLSSDLAEVNGLELPRLPDEAVEKLLRLKKSGLIPPIVVPNNPLDLSGSATPDDFEKAYETVSHIADIHLLIPLHTAPAMNEGVVEKIFRISRNAGKTVLGCDVGTSEYASLFRKLISQMGIPVFRELEDVMRTARLIAKNFTPSREFFPSFKPLHAVPANPVPRHEVVSLLRRRGVEVAKEIVVFDEHEAVHAADEVGFPVVMKLATEKLAHKSDFGGVVLNLSSKQQVVEAFRRLMTLAVKQGVHNDGVAVQEAVSGLELILGIKFDSVFGPVVTIGLGGFFAEALGDYVSLVAPVMEDEVKAMLRHLRYSKLLYQGFRNISPADINSLASTVVSFSKIVTENSHIVEIEVNPLIVNGRRCVAVDFRALRATNT
ncbi:MAG: acetate--CoA ligase family protein [Candidatus Caldarchaeum sp.]|nr:acetate--CoA ligase family protein [Candidatus Caldarchaeum sp.]